MADMLVQLRVGDTVTKQTFSVCDRSLALIIAKTGSGDDRLETENGKGDPLYYRQGDTTGRKQKIAIGASLEMTGGREILIGRGAEYTKGKTNQFR